MRHEIDARRPAERDDPRLRPEPDRAGDRVRLLLRARGDDRARVRARRGDGQLQPRDGLDRLRHVRPPVLRAADARGRAGDRRSRAAGGRDRPVRRSDAAEAGGRARGGGRAAARDAAGGDRPGRGARALRRAAAATSGSARRRTRLAQSAGGGARRRARASAGRCSCARATCSAGGRWRSSTTSTACATTSGGWPATAARSSSTASWRTRSRSTSTRSATARTCGSAAIMQHVEEAGIHSGDSACVLPPHSLGAEMLGEIREATRRIALGARRRRPAQRPVRRARRRPVRDRGQPARLADGPVRQQGDRAAAGQARLPRDAGGEARGDEPAGRSRRRPRLASRRRCCRSTASPAPTRCSARRCARPARSWASPPTSRPRSPRRRPRRGRGCRAPAPCSSRSPTPTSRRSWGSPPSCTTSASGSSPRAAPPRRSRGWGSRSSALNKVGEGSPHVVDWIENGDVDLVINTPTGTAARTDGYEIRRAAIARGMPCITTIAGGMAASRAIAAARPRRPGGRLAAGAARPGRGRVTRTLAPLGRRTTEIIARTEYGPYVVITVGDRRAAPRSRASSTCSPPPSAGAGARTSGRSCRGRSASCANATASLDFLFEDVGPGTNRLMRARRGRRAAAARPARRRLLAAARRPPPGARRRRRRHRAAGRSGATSSTARRRCSASATPRTPRARR